jgi:hypothetical protein
LAEAAHIGYTLKRAKQPAEEEPMMGSDVLQPVQFVTVKGKRLAVLSADDWEALIEWLETLEDIAIAKEAFAQLKAVDGDRTKARWLKWSDVADELA